MHHSDKNIYINFLTRKSTSRSSSKIRSPTNSHKENVYPRDMPHYPMTHCCEFHMITKARNFWHTILALKKAPMLPRKCLIVRVLIYQLWIQFLSPVKNWLRGACHMKIGDSISVNLTKNSRKTRQGNCQRPFPIVVLRNKFELESSSSSAALNLQPSEKIQDSNLSWSNNTNYRTYGSVKPIHELNIITW